jgi:hypothetical protein
MALELNVSPIFALSVPVSSDPLPPPVAQVGSPSSMIQSTPPPFAPLGFLRCAGQDLPGSWRPPCELALLFDLGGTVALGRCRTSTLSSALWDDGQ